MTLRPLRLILAASALALAVSPALADNGKGKGNGNGNGNGADHSTQTGQSGNQNKGNASHGAANPGKGDLASELKGLNAVKANPNAMKNAAPNSQVGRIATYRDAALATVAAATAAEKAAAAVAALPVPTRSLTEIEAAIAGLDPSAEGYAEALTALEAEKSQALAYAEATAEAAAAAEALAAAEAAEHEALLAASGGRELSDEAIAYIRDVLDL